MHSMAVFRDFLIIDYIYSTGKLALDSLTCGRVSMKLGNGLILKHLKHYPCDQTSQPWINLVLFSLHHTTEMTSPIMRRIQRITENQAQHIMQVKYVFPSSLMRIPSFQQKMTVCFKLGYLKTYLVPHAVPPFFLQHCFITLQLRTYEWLCHADYGFSFYCLGSQLGEGFCCLCLALWVFNDLFKWIFLTFLEIWPCYSCGWGLS